MKNRSGEKIKLASIDELLGVVNEESAMEIEISKIHPFKNHPFKVLDDEKMQDLVESVKINGVLTPVLLRMDENEDYETVSLTYYADGVLTDEFGNVIEDVEGMVGKESLTHFGEYEEDSVFVRNDSLKTDYEILRDTYNYSDTY